MSTSMDLQRKVGAGLVAMGLVLTSAGLLASPAGAATVTPTQLAGNPHCGPIGAHPGIGLSEADSLKFHGNGTSGPITMTNATANSFDFTSTRLVLAVIIKRANSADIYDYRPGGTLGDTGLVTTVKNSISHVQFCFGAAAATTTTAAPTTTTAAPTTTTAAPTTTTAAPTTTAAAPTTTTAAPTTTTTIVQVLPTSIVNTTTTAAPAAAAATTTTVVEVLGVEISRPLAATGTEARVLLLLAGLMALMGGVAVRYGRKETAGHSA